MKDHVKLTARKGDRVMTTWVLPQVATKVARGWADQGYAVTITAYPAGQS